MSATTKSPRAQHIVLLTHLQNYAAAGHLLCLGLLDSLQHHHPVAQTTGQHATTLVCCQVCHTRGVSWSCALNMPMQTVFVACFLYEHVLVQQDRAASAGGAAVHMHSGMR
jgi:hypothetical protein